MFAVFSAAAVIASGCFATVSADTPPDSYDTNGDGTVNIADVLSMDAMLKGEWKASISYYVDANQNGVIDYADRMCIMNYVLSGVVSTITMV